MTCFRRWAPGFLLLLAIPGFADTIKHRAAVPGYPQPNGTVTVTGQIRDVVTNLPIAGANVVAEGKKSTLTGSDGRYSVVVSKDRNVVITAEHFAYNSVAQAVPGIAGTVADFSLVPHPTVTLKRLNGETHVLDYNSAEFAYLIVFSGYVHGDVANFCKTDGTAFTPNKSDVKRMIGPAKLVNSSACCTRGQVVQIDIEMKTGERFPVNFADSCFGNEVDFMGREVSTGTWIYARWYDQNGNAPDLAEVDFP